MFTITEATQNMLGPNFWYFVPNVRMPVSVPILKAVIKGIDELISVLKPTSLEGQGFELFPPRFNQVEPTSIFRDKLNSDFRPGDQSCSNISGLVNSKIVLNYEPAVTGEDGDHLLQQLDVRSAITGGTAQDGCQTCGWFKCPVDPDITTTAVIRLERSPIRTHFPFLTRISFDGDRSQFVDTDDTCTAGRLDIGPDYGPLFSTNSGSCLSGSWNQLCCRFQSRPSACIQLHIVEGAKRRPYRSSYSLCSLVNVHSSNGNPSVRGFCRAKSMTRDRTSSVCVTGLPERGLSSSPSIPSLLNRLTQMDPEALLLKPTCNPASEAWSVGSSSMALINRARCTMRRGSLRELANRLISVSSSVVNVLSKTRGLDILPFQASDFGRYYILYT
jgi:hypothetical protein